MRRVGGGGGGGGGEGMGTMVVDGKLVRKKGTMRAPGVAWGTLRRGAGGGGGGVASGTMVIDEGAGGGMGTMVVGGGAGAPAGGNGKDDTPAFLKHVRGAASASGASAGSGGAGGGSGGGLASPPPPAPKARDIYTADAAFLGSLSAVELQDRLDQLDMQFRHDMTALTEKYDAARTSVEDAMAAKS